MNFLLPEIAVDDVQSLLWQLCKNFSAKVIWMTMQTDANVYHHWNITL